MQLIKSKADIQKVHEQPIAHAILETMQILEHQYEEPYQATLHGWFVVCEDEQDLIQWKNARKKSVKDSTLLREMALVHTVLEFARKEWHWIDRNPLTDVSKPSTPPHRIRPRRQPCKASRVEAVLAQARILRPHRLRRIR